MVISKKSDDVFFPHGLLTHVLEKGRFRKGERSDQDVLLLVRNVDLAGSKLWCCVKEGQQGLRDKIRPRQKR